MGAASEIGDQPQMRLLCAANIGIAVIRRDNRLLKTGIKMLSAHTLAIWAKSGVKSVVNRTRPESGDDPAVRWGDSDAHEENSFPSGHSAGAVSVAEAFARNYPNHALAARTAAFVVAAVQVPRGTHYAGDVAAGVVIGFAAEKASEAALGRGLRSFVAGTL
jgi:membrane-associated phospholipid phosphatase